MSLEPGTVVDEWKVIDRWWTAEPITRYYRACVAGDGRHEIIEVRRGETGEWTPQGSRRRLTYPSDLTNTPRP